MHSLWGVPNQSSHKSGVNRKNGSSLQDNGSLSLMSAAVDASDNPVLSETEHISDARYNAEEGSFFIYLCTFYLSRKKS